MKLTHKSIFFIILLFIYLGLITYIFITSLPKTNILTQSSSSENSLKKFIVYLNPYNDTVKSFSVLEHSSNLESASFYILNPYTQNYRNNLISHLYSEGWTYKIYTNHVNFLKGGYLISYSKSQGNNTFVEMFILKNKINKNIALASLFKRVTYPNIGSYPFTQNEMLQALASLNNNQIGNITEQGFNYYPLNLKNVATFKNNKPIENIEGFAILNSASQTQINNLLHFYMNEFKVWGYIPFTVYGAIIDNNTIYYLKYGLGAVTIEVKIVKNITLNYSTIYYTAEVTASSTNNYLLEFQKQGWQKTFN